MCLWIPPSFFDKPFPAAKSVPGLRSVRYVPCQAHIKQHLQGCGSRLR